jgi:hypothetical protein
MLGKQVMKRDEIISNPKYPEISRQFELLFKKKGYYLGDKLDKNTWFIRSDKFKSQTTPNPNNHLASIINDLNEADTPNQIRIGVDNFIYTVCERIIEANDIKNKITLLIKKEKDTTKDSINELRENLSQNIVILTGLIEKSTSLAPSSTLGISILEMDGFPVSNYSFEIKTNDPTLIKKENAESKEKNYENFESKKLINEYNSKDYYLEQRFKIKHKNNSTIFREIIKRDKRTFEKIEFCKCSYINYDENYSERTFSGCSLSTLSVICKNDSIKYEGSLYMYDFFLNSIDQIMRDGRSLNKIINLNLKNDNEKVSIRLELEINFDLHTLHGIYERIFDLYERVINQKNQFEELIQDLLDHFEEINETVQNILDRKIDDRRDGCCQCLII